MRAVEEPSFGFVSIDSLTGHDHIIGVIILILLDKEIGPER